MKNDRISNKERNLIKGSIRRVFSRSELRKQVINACMLKDYTDTTRPRVKSWGLCNLCKQPTPKSYLQADHIIPIVPVDKQLIDMSWDDLVNNLWCDISNLQACCETCHRLKSSCETKERAKYRPKKVKKTK